MADDRKIVPITSAGRTVYVEVSSVSLPVVGAKSSGFAPASALKDYFESLEEAIDSTCEMILEGVTRMAKRATPSKVSAEFSFELGGEGRIWFVAKGNAKATVTISVEWDLGSNSELVKSLTPGSSLE